MIIQSQRTPDDIIADTLAKIVSDSQRCERCGRDKSNWNDCPRFKKDCARAEWRGFEPIPESKPMLSTRIISVTEPGYDVALFFNSDGGAVAVITRPNEKPIGVNIMPPAPGRRIVVHRKGSAFEVLYVDWNQKDTPVS